MFAYDSSSIAADYASFPLHHSVHRKRFPLTNCSTSVAMEDSTMAKSRAFLRVGGGERSY